MTTIIYDNNEKAGKGKMEAYYDKVLILYVMW